MDHKVMTITPEMAETWLLCNSKNRPLSERRSEQLARTMSRGEWELNGDAVRFAETGVLIDGQHRLRAIVRSGVSIESLVVTGLSESTFDVIDQGKARSPSEVLSMRGEVNTVALASSVRMLHLWRTTGNPFDSSTEAAPSPRQLEATLDENPGIRRCIRTAESRWIKKFITVRLAAFSFFVFENSPLGDSVESFYDSLENGESAFRGDPVMLLRDMLMEDKAASAKRGMNKSYKLALIFKAFTKHAYHEPVKFLRVRTKGNKEKDLFRTPC